MGLGSAMTPEAGVSLRPPAGSRLLPKADRGTSRGDSCPLTAPALPPHGATWLPASQPCLDLHPLLVTQNHPALRSPGAGMLTEGLRGWGLGPGVECGELGGGGWQG